MSFTVKPLKLLSSAGKALNQTDFVMFAWFLPA